MDEDPGEPTWMYRQRSGQVESKLFNSNEIPEGWVDSPAKCVEESVGATFNAGASDYEYQTEAKKPARRRGRPRKVKDGNDS